MKRTHVTTQSYGTILRYGHRVLIADGTLKACTLAPGPDSYFSVAASIRIKRTTVKGYVTPQEVGGITEHVFRPLNSEKLAHPHLVWKD